MSNADDIERFRAAHAGAIKKAGEFARRAFKGLPADRYASADDMFLVAQGIKALNDIIRMQTAVIVAQHKTIQDMFNENQKRCADAMEASADPMRHD